MRPIRALLSSLALACSVALAAQAQTAPPPIDIPAGDLVAALDALARQSGAQFVYRADRLRGLRTPGAHGARSADEALDQLLRGSGFAAQRDASGAVVIVERKAPAAPSRPAARPASNGQSAPAASEDAPEVQELQAVEVTGSRIPRAQVEGPAPVTVITAEDIRASGFTTVPDVLRAMTQNGGETQSQQSASGADFSPGAQQVDLRGLGPNHTLVLVNGRRIADFPLPFKGRSNFTDISNIPLGMVDRIEVLTGSASAIYGSDAISGVVNFILKRKADGVTVDFRYGDTSRGGGESFDYSLSGGFSRGNFNSVFGAELISQKPLWAYERGIQDSTKDAPTTGSRIARRAFLRTDWWDTYLDPGADACAALSHLNDGSTYYASRPRYGDWSDELDDWGPGYYCGSDESIGYGTIISRRQGVNAYASMSYLFDNGSEWFADLQLGHHKLALFRDVTAWSYMAPDGNEEGYFYNQATDQVEYWQRQFSPEEMGGLENGTIRNVQKTLGLTTGFKGTFARDWDYEASLSHSQYRSRISWPQIVASAANDLFLGPQVGFNEDWGYPVFDADPARLYTPLTRAEYDAIAADTVYHPESRTDTLAFTVTNTELFRLPGGPAGFAATAELGNQAYDLNPDPLATQYYYYSWKDSDGHGDRYRWALAGELRLPLLQGLNLSAAGRYDQYRYSGRDPGKFTWSAGVEWRPLESLLLRGSYGTAFRAPDLHYLYAGPGNDETSVTDYYRCATEEPDEAIDDCSYSGEGIIRGRSGNLDLDPETSTSWTAGVVWSPLPALDFSLDWFDIDMRDQVQDLRADEVMRNEADCRLGELDPSSPTCVDALSRITRLANGSIYGVYVNPINIARESTSGVDFSVHYRLETGIGTFRFGGDYTWVHAHDIQVYAGDLTIDEFVINSGYDIPRTKASANVSWERNGWAATLHGQRLGRLPNGWSYDEVWEEGDPGPWIEATYRYNATLAYNISNHARISLIVDNLTDEMPPRDPTYTAYPYYDISWFDSLGRSYYLNFTYKFGGEKL